MTAATQVQWRVQVRKSRAHKWRNKGLFETRNDARCEASWHRLGGLCSINWGRGIQNYVALGMGNVRVVRYVKGEKC